MNQELLPLNFESPTFIVPLDASGGSVFLNLLGAAEGALIRAAASTQPFGVLVNHPLENNSCKLIEHFPFFL